MGVGLFAQDMFCCVRQSDPKTKDVEREKGEKAKNVLPPKSLGEAQERDFRKTWPTL